MFRFLIPVSLMLGASAFADDLVTLTTGEAFTGDVLSLSDGIVAIRSPHSEMPLRIRNENLQRLRFGETSTEDLPKDSQVLNLRNGDAFPGEVVALTEEQVSFKTWFAGQIEIPREQIESIFFGVTPQTTLYRGPISLSGWQQSSDRSWEYDNGRLRAKGRGSIGKDVDLPSNFIFSTRFSWNQTPNLRIHLCGDNVPRTGDPGTDSYLLTINTSGVEIRRVHKSEDDKTSFYIISTYTNQLRNLPTSELDIEVRIDRDTRLIKLTVNGEEVPEGYDPIDPPAGSYIVFESLNSGQNDSQIDDIHIQEWDAKTQRFRTEPRSEEQTDTLTVEEGDRFSGKIVGFDPASELKIFEFIAPQSQESIKVPLKNCSVMYFSKAESLPESQGEYRLELQSGGSLTISNIELGGEFLEAIHPWLGKMRLDRRIMSSIGKGKKVIQ